MCLHCVPMMGPITAIHECLVRTRDIVAACPLLSNLGDNVATLDSRVEWLRGMMSHATIPRWNLDFLVIKLLPVPFTSRSTPNTMKHSRRES